MHVQHSLCTLIATTDKIGRMIAVELHNVISFAGLCLQRTSLLNSNSTLQFYLSLHSIPSLYHCPLKKILAPPELLWVWGDPYHAQEFQENTFAGIPGTPRGSQGTKIYKIINDNLRKNIRCTGYYGRKGIFVPKMVILEVLCYYSINC